MEKISKKMMIKSSLINRATGILTAEKKENFPPAALSIMQPRKLSFDHGPGMTPNRPKTERSSTRKISENVEFIPA